MYIDKRIMGMMDISKFFDEAKQNREYIDYAIKTENYVLMKKELYEKFMKSQVNWTAAENKLENKIDFSIEYSNLINEDDILRIIAEKIVESREIK